MSTYIPVVDEKKRARYMLQLFNEGWHVGTEMLTPHSRLLTGMEGFQHEGEVGILMFADDPMDCDVDQIFDEITKPYKENKAEWIYSIDVVYGLMQFHDGQMFLEGDGPFPGEGTVIDDKGGVSYAV